MNVLLFLDMQFLWNSCCAQYGKRARANINNVVEKAKSRKTDTVQVVAFIAMNPEKNQNNLIRKLVEMGFGISEVTVDPDGIADFTEAMKRVLAEHIDTIDGLALASGDLRLLSIIEQVNHLNKSTKLIAFCNGMSSVIAKEADDIKLLDKKDTISQ